MGGSVQGMRKGNPPCQRTCSFGTHRDLTETISLYRHLGWTVTEATGLKIMMQKPLPRS
jgi:hypothetical protein